MFIPGNIEIILEFIIIFFNDIILLRQFVKPPFRTNPEKPLAILGKTNYRVVRQTVFAVDFA
jgi:hypothetical protein